MSRWLAIQETPFDTSTKVDKSPPERPIRPFCQVLSKCRSVETELVPDVDAFEERAAIIEFDAGLSRREAEHLAAQQQGYDNVVDLRRALEGRK